MAAYSLTLCERLEETSSAPASVALSCQVAKPSTTPGPDDAATSYCVGQNQPSSNAAILCRSMMLGSGGNGWPSSSASFAAMRGLETTS